MELKLAPRVRRTARDATSSGCGCWCFTGVRRGGEGCEFESGGVWGSTAVVWSLFFAAPGGEVLTVRLFVGDCRRPWLGLVAIKRGPLAHLVLAGATVRNTGTQGEGKGLCHSHCSG